MAESRLSTLHLSTAHTWRGGENQILLLAQGLVARGHRALIVAPKGAPLLERAHEAGLATRALTLRGDLDPAGTWRLARLLREVRPDVLHLHDGHAVLPGQLAARALPGSRLAVIAHRRTSFPLRGRWKYAGRVDKVIAISQAARQRVLAAGVAPERVAVVYSGLEFPALAPREGLALRRELGLSPEAVLIAHAAALTAEKRAGDLLGALRLCAGSGVVKEGAAPDVHLAIAGSGELEGALRELACRLNVAGRVHFLGFRRDLRPLWAAAQIAAFSSEAEGLCTALIEAQGAGLPAVVTDAGGMVEVVAAQVTGLVARVGAVEELAAAFRRLAADAALRGQLGSAARARVRKHFSAAAMVENTLRVYREARAAR
jgi:glycosyltransferase involved in cell wall biosynthesis